MPQLKAAERMPPPDAAILARRDRIIADLSAIVPGEGVMTDETSLRTYESDGLTAYATLPMVVVLPETVDQVSRVLAYCHKHGVKVVPRGAGTSLSGGALPLADAVTIGLGKFSRILEIVPYADKERAASRVKFLSYRDQGIRPQKHEISK